MFPAIGSTNTAAICPRMLFREILDRAEIVVAGDQGVRGRGSRHTGACRHSEGRGSRSGGDQERIGVAVVTPRKLDDLVAFRRCPCNPDRAHRRLGPGTDEPDTLHRRHQHRDPLSEPRLEFGRRTKARPARGRLRECFQQSLWAHGRE